jgi:uncharacterized coiled-coil DUF342 family protein
MPGSPLKKAEEIAAQVKNEILEHVKAPRALVVEVATGVAEYSSFHEKFTTTAHEVDELIRIATEKSGV